MGSSCATDRATESYFVDTFVEVGWHVFVNVGAYARNLAHESYLARAVEIDL